MLSNVWPEVALNPSNIRIRETRISLSLARCNRCPTNLWRGLISIYSPWLSLLLIHRLSAINWLILVPSWIPHIPIVYPPFIVSVSIIPCLCSCPMIHLLKHSTRPVRVWHQVWLIHGP
ncbi:hypothetical protein HanRHA438_Chr11g0496521 [Helianthus annuus]|nr:hypothetical protein HanRHA438_Chr11g0496521 [Helianthus annuus]